MAGRRNTRYSPASVSLLVPELVPGFGHDHVHRLIVGTFTGRSLHRPSDVRDHQEIAMENQLGKTTAGAPDGRPSRLSDRAGGDGVALKHPCHKNVNQFLHKTAVVRKKLLSELPLSVRLSIPNPSHSSRSPSACSTRAIQKHHVGPNQARPPSLDHPPSSSFGPEAEEGERSLLRKLLSGDKGLGDWVQI